MNNLTIAIPTFNRRDRIVSTVRGLRRHADVLVIDDGSTDGTFDALADSGATVIRHPDNRGYPHAFMSIFVHATTDWVLVAADDDYIEPARIHKLRDYIDDYRLDFVSTRHRDGDATYRGQADGPIDPVDYRAAAAHASGLVYRTSFVLACRPFLAGMLAEGNTSIETYPQLLPAAIAIARQRAAWWSGSVTGTAATGDVGQSGIRDAAGRRYWDPESRVMQALGAERWLTDVQRTLDEAAAGRMRTMRAVNARTVYPSVRACFEWYGDGLPMLDRATARTAIRRGPVPTIHHVPPRKPMPKAGWGPGFGNGMTPPI